MKIELHCHTKYSDDSLLLFHALYWKCVACGIRYIAITEHNNLRGAEAFASFCRKRGNKVSVIKGEEIFTSQGEIIGLFLDSEIEPGLSPEETILRIREQNGIVYVPHPYDQKRKKQFSLKKQSKKTEIRLTVSNAITEEIRWKYMGWNRMRLQRSMQSQRLSVPMHIQFWKLGGM